MNETNLSAWLTDLRTTTTPQVEGYLTMVVDRDVIGYCCLGRGEVVRGAVPEQVRVEGAMATRQFVDWLGIDMHDHKQWHLEEGLGDECGCEFDLGIETMHYCDYHENPYYLTAAGLNDDGFTFKQIADVINYFGIDRAIHQ